MSDKVVRRLYEVTFQQILGERETGSKDTRKNILGSGKGRCKGPEAGLLLVSWRTIRGQCDWSKVREARADQVGEWTGSRHQEKHASGFSHRKGSGVRFCNLCCASFLLAQF